MSKKLFDALGDCNICGHDCMGGSKEIVIIGKRGFCRSCLEDLQNILNQL